MTLLPLVVRRAPGIVPAAPVESAPISVCAL